MNQETIGTQIKYLRKVNNLTQKQLSEQLHVTEQAVSKWENGRNLPDTETICELCKLFDVTIDDFMQGKAELSEAVEEQYAESKIFPVIRGVIYALLGSFIAIILLNYANNWGLF